MGEKGMNKDGFEVQTLNSLHLPGGLWNASDYNTRFQGIEHLALSNGINKVTHLVLQQELWLRQRGFMKAHTELGFQCNSGKFEQFL